MYLIYKTLLKNFFLICLSTFILVPIISCTNKDLPVLPETYLKAMNYTDKALKYYHHGCFENAMESNFKALDLFTAIDNQVSIADTFNNIGNIYYSQCDFNQAELFYKKALTICRINNLKFKQAVILTNIASIFIQNNKYNKAQVNLDSAEKIFNSLNIIFTPFISNKLLFYIGKKDFKNASALIKNNLNSIEKNPSLNNDPSYLYARGMFLQGINNYKLSLQFFKKALLLDKKQENMFFIAKDLSKIAEIYQSAGNIKLSFDYFVRSLNVFILIKNKQMVNLTTLKIESIITHSKDLDLDLSIYNYYRARFNDETLITTPCE